MNRVAVTGMGIIDPLGASPKECFDSMLDTSYSHPPLFKHSRLEDIDNNLYFLSIEINLSYQN